MALRRRPPLVPAAPRCRCLHRTAALPSPQLITQETPELTAAGLVLQHEFITRDEEAELLSLADERLAGEAYVDDHYDGVISGYRECAVPILEIDAPGAAAAVQRMRQAAWDATHGAKQRGIGMFPHVQVIDMPPTGRINAHRDNMKMFGEFTTGLNLLSSAVLRFEPFWAASESPGEGQQQQLPSFDVVLHPRTIYVMHGSLRWQYTHAILDAEATDGILAERAAEGGHPDSRESTIDSNGGGEDTLDTCSAGEALRIPRRGRRVSIIARDLGAPGFFGGTYSAFGMVM
jgi:hypothetical protein